MKTVKKEKQIIDARSLSNIEKANLRLSCLSMVINSGNAIDRKAPLDKAEEFYSFVIGKSKKTKAMPDKKPIEEAKEVQTQKEQEYVEDKVTINKAPSDTSHPFGNSGREQVVLS